MALTVYTIGHSTRDFPDFLALLEREGIAHLCDIRTIPGSRRYPQYNRETLADLLEENGIEYSHEAALGGRRRARPDSPNTAWRNEGFRGYADYMLTEEFAHGVDTLLEIARQKPTVVMCAEAVPWRCHRNLLSDALVIRGVQVKHIMDTKTTAHELTQFAVVRDGLVTYPAGGAAPDRQEELFR